MNPNKNDHSLVVLAAAAHPDDIEFCFAGTLLLLREAGCEIHLWNLANGCCGSLVHSPEELVRIRREEAQASAGIAGGVSHSALFDDLAIFYDRPSLAAVSAVVRSIRPQIVLTHSPQDYMEDHENVCRLVVSAVFGRGMPNYHSEPSARPYALPVRIYHAAPHGLNDGLGVSFQPDFLIDIESTLERKSRMLGCHRSQQSWLEATQQMSAYTEEMAEMARVMARCGDGIKCAEGWRRHAHLGFCPASFDPLPTLLSRFMHPVVTINSAAL